MSQLDLSTSRVEPEKDAISEEFFQVFLSQRVREPSWLRAYRETNWQQYKKIPSPNRKAEPWRFGDPRQLAPGICCPSMEENDEISLQDFIENSSLFPSAIARIVLVNDHCIEEAALPPELHDKGLIFESLESALLKRPDEVRPHLEAEEIDLGSRKQRSLHGAFLRNGAYLRVPAGMVVGQPLVVYHWIKEKSNAIFPHTIIDAEEGAEATLVDVYLSADAKSEAFACAISSARAAPNANVTRVATQNWNLKTKSYLLESNQSARDATIRNFTILLGSGACRHETTLGLNEPGSEVRARSIVAASGDQLFDQRSRQDHRAEHTASNLLCKNALLDQARSIFAGLIRVEENAQHSDAYQTNRNLVIGPSAEANSLPGLEILANDVKCSHGATTGKIDEDQLFYLRSRGIPSNIAKQLLMLGFFEEVLSEIPSQIAGSIRELLQSKMESNAN